jgi:NAD(P)H-flavin reductase
MNADVLHLRLQPAIRLRYQAGQHVLLWSDDGVARPYSFASLPRHDSGLDFHIDCSQPGRFRDFARSLRLGDVMRLGVPGGGALRLEPEWDEAELLLIASGTGLAPLWAVLQEARMHGHSGPIRLVHVAKSAEAHYLSNELLGLQARWPQLSVSLVVSGQADGLSLIWRTVSRRTMALVCGGPDFVETVVRQLYMAGLPRARIRTDIFLPNKDQ